MEKLISFISVSIFLITMFYGNFLYKRLNRPGYITRMRVTCWLASIASFLFFIITALRSSRLLNSLLYHASISYQVPYQVIVGWLLSVFMFVWFKKFWLYYIRHDEKTILTGWYIKKHSSLLTKQKFDEAYQYVQKASQLSPDFICIWCTLASFSEHFLKSPDQADQHLAKAKQVLDSSGQPTDKDKAVLEHYTGTILQYRGRLQQGLEHMKKAYDLDPTPYRKKEYESALKKTQETQGDAHS